MKSNASFKTESNISNSSISEEKRQHQIDGSDGSRKITLVSSLSVGGMDIAFNETETHKEGNELGVGEEDELLVPYSYACWCFRTETHTIFSLRVCPPHEPDLTAFIELDYSKKLLPVKMRLHIVLFLQKLPPELSI